MSKKIEKEFKIEYDFDWEWGISIEDIRKDLDELEKLGATHINLESQESWGCASLDQKAVCTRMETDEEFKERIDKYNARQEKFKQSEMITLKRLQDKYNK
tara:strand:- start:76 stop:378 length:303 start_codon:yes stop_codon:yes gene_type:complete